MAEDTFRANGASLTEPPRNAVAVTPDDDDGLLFMTRAVHVGGAGDLRVVMASGVTVTLASIPAGTMIPIRVTKVLDTGTTATAIVGLW